MATINEVWVAFEEAQGRWSGCNWPTRYGSLGLDLDGVSSGNAHQAARRWRAIAADAVAGDDLTAGEEACLVDMAAHLRLGRAVAYSGDGPEDGLRVCGRPARCFCATTLGREWEYAAYWLEEIESDARWAEEEAQDAVRAAEDGDWGDAIGHAGQACSIQSGYDAPRPWRRLKRAIDRAAR
jgi:hypothetical protein